MKRHSTISVSSRSEAFATPFAATARHLRLWFFARPGTSRLLVICAALLAWEVSARLFGDPLFVAAPSQVVAGIPDLIATPGMAEALLTTAREIVAAFALSTIVGAGLGLVLGLSRFANRSFMPVVLLLYGIPQVTIIPLFIMFFGVGPASKIAYGFSHGLFPILITVAAGARDIDAVLLKACWSMGAKRRDVFRHVVLPHIVPSFFTALRLGMTSVLLGVILAELYVSVTGVGFFSKQFAQSFHPAPLFGLIALVATIAIIINESLRLLEARLTLWREK